MIKKEFVALQCGTPNGNNRLYPSVVFAEAIKKMKFPVFGVFMNTIKPGQAGTIDLEQASHTIESARVDEQTGEAFVTIKTLKTPNGKILEKFIDSDLITFRPRSFVEFETPTVEGHFVVRKCDIITFDVVDKALAA